MATCRRMSPKERLRQIIFVHVTRYGAHLAAFPLKITPAVSSGRASGGKRMCPAWSVTALRHPIDSLNYH